MYNTKTLSLGNLIYYILMNLLGHMYVCTVNLNYVNGCFHSAYNTISDFYMTIAFAPIFFFISGVISLRAVDDLSETECQDGI